jgi:hypothetical protein
VAALTKEALTRMSLKKCVLMAALVLAAALSGGLGAFRSVAGGPVGPQSEAVREGQADQATPAPTEVVFRAPAPESAPFAWGRPQNGLRVGFVQVGGDTGRLTVALENVGKNDLVVNLGLMLANGRKQYPTALAVVLTDRKGAVRRLRLASPVRVAGRVDPFLVPLPAGCRYSLNFDLSKLTEAAEGLSRAEAPPPGRYPAAVEFVGKAVTRAGTNRDTEGLALMPCWTGTVRSGEVRLTLPARRLVGPRGDEGAAGWTELQRMFPDGRAHDFGNVRPGELLTHAFRVVNTSGSPLQLTSVRVSAACLTVAVTKKVLAPKEMGKVTVTLDAGRFKGRKRVNVYLTTERPGEPAEVFTFSVQADSRDVPAAPAVRHEDKASEYRAVFDRALTALGDNFTIAYANRFAGRVEATSDLEKLPTGAAVRRRTVVQIAASDQGGFLVEVRVFKEVEDNGKMAPAGRDEEHEQRLLRRILSTSPGPGRR